MDAYSTGDDTEEVRKLRQQYQTQLKEAEDSLKETQWDRYISETGDLLQNMYDDYEEVLNARLDDIDLLFKDMMQVSKDNTQIIKTTIESVSSNVGYGLGLALSDIISKGITVNGEINTMTNKVNSMASHIKQYASGGINLKDVAAWTQDNGAEIVRTKDGALLTPIGNNGMVFNNEMSKNLWELAKNPDVYSKLSKGVVMPGSSVGNTINQDNNVTIVLNEVQNYEQFKTALQNDIKYNQFIQEITLGAAMGKNSLTKNKYK